MKIKFIDVFNVKKNFQRLFEIDSSDNRYDHFRRNIRIIMIILTMFPLTVMALINYHQFLRSLRHEIITPEKVLVNKTRHSIEFFLKERLSLLKSISHMYTYEELAEINRLNRILYVLKKEFSGFVDLGIIDGKSGDQLCYSGPYKLQGKNYRDQSWFQEVNLNGTYISDVFMGHRKFPHIAIAVQHFERSGRSWVIRTTIDTKMFDNFIDAMQLGAKDDAFILNKHGVFQTSSRMFGDVLEKFPIHLQTSGHATYILETRDKEGDDIFIAYTHFSYPEYTLVFVKSHAVVLRTWFALKSELFWVFLIGSVLIVIVVFQLTTVMVNRIKEADQNRELAFRELEHHRKLSSIGRLAAGVAHEINNPMAIINEKAGLMEDLIGFQPDFKNKEKFLAQIMGILKSVKRCRNITHRLLGFAKRMDVQIETINLNGLIEEVLSFLEREALYKNIEIQLNLDENIPGIDSDRGQLQQVFLNVINNAMAAIDEGGVIIITTQEKDDEFVMTSIQDNGCGMSEETCRKIFEPFFTQKQSGTGLGLPITYGIIKKLGGNIEVKSKINEGSTFYISLPLKSMN
jgi:two-component system NtrC family sensor kinase